MLKRVVFYDKKSGGHRPHIQGIIRDYLRPSNYTFQIVTDPEERNSLTFLRELYQREKFDHCHMMTLHDCIEDFYEDEEVHWFQEARITFSGTLYLFRYLSPHIMLLLRNMANPLRNPLQRKDLRAIIKVMKSGIVSTITIPDERISQTWRYPFWRKKLRIIPDPAVFSNEFIDCQRAKLDFGWDPQIPTLLMFGAMYWYKELNLLIDALSERYTHYFCSPIRLVLAGQQMNSRKHVACSSVIELIEYNHYVEDALAKQLFAAADCVIMPFGKWFECSSGTFSLACASGKFVIVPEHGVLGWRVRKFGNGNVFKSGDPASLAAAISRFVERYRKLSFPIEGSVNYAATCTPSRYVEILDSIIRESLEAVHYR